MSEATHNENALERLLVDEDERPDEIETEDVTIDTNEFHDRLATIATAADAIETLATDLRALRRSGLDDEDVVALLYGRNASLNKSTIESVLETVDEISSRAESGEYATKRDLLIRLVADAGSLGKRETDDVFDELERVVEKYGYDELRDDE